MAYIDKLLNKFNKVQNSINSLKGISAKIQSLNYNTEIDKLKENKTAALKKLSERNDNLKKLNQNREAIGKNISKEFPGISSVELKYPLHDELSNYLVFDIRKRTVDKILNSERQEPDAIALYVPDTLTSTASVSYGDADVGPMRRAAVNIIDALMSPNNDLMNVAGQQTDNLIQTGKQQIKNMITGGISNMRAGIASNPQKEVTLNPLEFRTFSFDYEFNPRSEEEANYVRQIIHTFKSSMLPDTINLKDEAKNQGLEIESTIDNNAFYSFPSLFDIYFDGPVADKIDGFLPAVCTQAEVNYAGGQKFATFYDGQPVKITLSLSFQEIRVLTRTNYEQISAYKNDNLQTPNLSQGKDSLTEVSNLSDSLSLLGIDSKKKKDGN